MKRIYKRIVDIFNSLSSEERQLHIKNLFGAKRLGFKMTEADMSCRGFKFELNKTFKLEGPIIPCEHGFHLCQKFSDVYDYYTNTKGDKRMFLVEYGANYVCDFNKIVTDEITFLEEINILEYLKENMGMDEVEWRQIAYSQTIPQEFLEEHFDVLKKHLDGFLTHTPVSEDFLRNNQIANWCHVAKNQKLSEPFIKEFKHKLDWYYVCEHQDLSEDTIRECLDYVKWYHISAYQKLSESFMREFKDYLYWSQLSYHQNFSESFILEFKYQLNFTAIKERGMASKEFMKKHKKLFIEN